MEYKMQDIFGITNKVPITYVTRYYVDDKFIRAMERNKHIVIYGCSKQGKTSLRKKNLDQSESLVIQCSNTTSREIIYQNILKEAGIELSISHTKTINGKQKMSVTLSGEGNAIFAKLKGGGQFETESNKSNSTTIKSFEIDPSDVNDVIRVLLQINFRKWIVLEDFHYLNDEVQKQISADLKAFYEKTDYIRVIIIGVWLESGRLTKLNGDLEGRIEYINADIWKKNELYEILRIGEKLLNITFSLIIKDKIVFYCKNNVGLLQEMAEKICDMVRLTKTQSKYLLILDDGEINKLQSYISISTFDNSQYISAKFITSDEVKQYSLTAFIAKNMGVLNIKEIDDLNFIGGPIDSWLALSKDRESRYTNFLRDFAEGPKNSTTNINIYRWISYSIIKASIEELCSGLSIRHIYKYSQEYLNSNEMKGDYSVLNQDIRFALSQLRIFHHELQVSPPVLDFDAAEDILRIVDSGFLLYHSTNNTQKLLTVIGLNHDLNRINRTD